MFFVVCSVIFHMSLASYYLLFFYLFFFFFYFSYFCVFFACFFFFQAEDGIRDLYVTGVQTCALPIYARGGAGDGVSATALPALVDPRTLVDLPGSVFVAQRELRWTDVVHDEGDTAHGEAEIGRASCREKV